MVPGRDEHLVDYSSIPVVNADHGASSCVSSDKLTNAVHRSIVSSVLSFLGRPIYAYASSLETLLPLYLYRYLAVHLSSFVLLPGYVVVCCEISNPLQYEQQSKTSMTKDHLRIDSFYAPDANNHHRTDGFTAVYPPSTAISWPFV